MPGKEPAGWVSVSTGQRNGFWEVGREEAGSQLLHSLMPPKAHFLEGDTIGCALLNKIPQRSQTLAVISEDSSVSYLWECLWFLQAASFNKFIHLRL